MKTFKLTILILTASASAAFSQGVITFGNNIPGILVAPIYVAEDGVNDYADAKTGNTATGIPAGTQIYYGRQFAGLLVEGWSVSFWAAFGTNITSGYDLFSHPTLITTATIGTGTSAGFFSTTPVSFYFLPSTGQATVQVRVWDSAGGTRTWDQAWFAGGPRLAGASALFTADIGGTALGFRSFSAGFLDSETFAPPVPEPSVIGLFGFGALLLGWRWRQQKS